MPHYKVTERQTRTVIYYVEAPNRAEASDQVTMTGADEYDELHEVEKAEVIKVEGWPRSPRIRKTIRPTPKIDYIVFEDDPEGLSWKAAEYVGQGAAPQVVLMALGYRDGSDELVDSLSTIDFYEDSPGWTRGTFRRVRDIPAVCEHLRDIARDMGLPA